MEHETVMDLAAEIRDSIAKLTTELKLTRLQLKAIHETFQEVVDPGARENFPGYIRIKQVN